MKTVICAGHICLDITPVFPQDRDYKDIASTLVPGKLINTENADIHTGGSVANTGLALKKIGCDVRLLGKVGDDIFGGIIKRIIEEAGAGGIITDTASSTSYSIVLAVPGIDRVFLHNPGANDTFASEDISDQALEGASLFHFGYPTIMKRMYGDGGEELLSVFKRVKSMGTATGLDLSAVDPKSDAGRVDWEALLGKVLPYVDFFVPSFEELCFMLERDRYESLASLGGDMTEHISMESDVVPLARKITEMGCPVLLIKCGTRGMVYMTSSREAVLRIGEKLELDADEWSNKQGIQPCFRAPVVKSATGAGDTSIAAFYAAVLKGKTPAECVRLASAEGACSVTSYDALGGIRTIEELEVMISSGILKEQPV